MRSILPIVGVLLRAGLSLAKPYLHEENGMVSDFLPNEKQFVVGRGLNQRQASCLGSYELVATGAGASPTGIPDPNFDFFTFCSAFIRPTKTYTLTLRSSTPPPVVTVTLTKTRSSTRHNPTSTPEGPVFVTVTITSVRSSKPLLTSTEEGPIFVTVTVTGIKTSSTSSIKPTSTNEEEPPIVTVTITASNYSPYKPSTSKSASITSTTSLGITRTQPTTSRTSSTSTASSTSQVPIPPLPTTTTTTRQQPTATGTLCPTPLPSQSCAISGWGYADNNLYSGSPITAGSCSQLCLANPDCKSYQTQDSTYEAPICNLYKVIISGTSVIPGAAAPYLFYDRECADLAPLSCSDTIAPQITSQPTLNVGIAAAIERRQGIKSIPWFLEPFAPQTISEVCSCIITVVPPAIGYTMTVQG
ncbi:hypothetical protein WAI453_010378 [Rhynchosporium graminicola]